MTASIDPLDLDRFIGVPEAAERLGVHPVTARRWVRKNQFPVPVHTVGGTQKVSLRLLVDYINAAAA